MRKLLIVLVSVLFFQTSGLLAQDNPDKMLRKASRSLSSYFLDQQRNQDELKEAHKLIDKVVQSEELKEDAKAWVKRGEVYNALSARFIKRAATGQAKMPKENPAYIAYESFMKGFDYAERNYRRKDVYKGIKETASHLSNIGNMYIGMPDYENAYESFNSVLEINELLKSEDEGNVFENQADLNSQKFVVAACAMQTGKNDKAKKLLNDLYSDEYDDARVYSYLFKLLVDENPEKAEKVMAKGKKMYPGNVDLLFAEINYLLQNNKYKELETKLQQAIEKDPENPSVRLALGNVYRNLFKEARENGSKDTANIYFNNSLDYFNQTLELDSTNFDAVYSMGMMYFNKGAAITQEMQDLSIDEQEKYEKLDKKVNEMFQKALPYFKKAERMNPNDKNTLIGLQEILARMNKLEESQKIKKRLKAVQGGKEYQESYYDSKK